MSTLQVMRSGFSKTNHRISVVFFLYGIQLVFTLILLFPFRQRIQDILGNSLMGRELLAGQGAGFFIEWISHSHESISAITPLFVMLGLLYLLISLFFQGGILESFRKDKTRFPFTDFLNASARFFGRFLSLFILFFFFTACAFLLFSVLGSALKRIAGNSEQWQVILFISRTFLLLVLFHVIQMIFDYAKIATVHGDKKNMWKTGLRSWRFVFTRFGSTVLLYVLFCISGLAFSALFLCIQHGIQHGF